MRTIIELDEVPALTYVVGKQRKNRLMRVTWWFRKMPAQAEHSATFNLTLWPQGRCLLSSDILQIHSSAGVISRRLKHLFIFALFSTLIAIPALSILARQRTAGCQDTGLFSSSQGFSDAPSLALLSTPTSSRLVSLGTICLLPVSLGPVHQRE